MKIGMIENHSRIMEVDAILAEKMLTHLHPDQRKVNTRRVTRYALAMKNGGWSPLSESIVFGRVGDKGEYVLLNGQHRLLAVIESGVAIKFTVEYATFDSDESMRHAYALLDGGLERNEEARIKAVGVHDNIGVTASIARKGLAAIKLIAWDFDHAASNNVDRAVWTSLYDEEKALLFFKNEIRGYYKAIQSARKTLLSSLLTRPVMAIGLVTFKYAQFDAHNFWNAVAYPLELKRGAPEFALNEYLKDDYRVGTNADILPHCKRIAAAWNAYAQGRTISSLRAVDGTNIQVACTLFDGKSGKTGLALVKDAIAQGDDIVGEEVN